MKLPSLFSNPETFSVQQGTLELKIKALIHGNPGTSRIRLITISTFLRGRFVCMHLASYSENRRYLLFGGIGRTGESLFLVEMDGSRRCLQVFGAISWFHISIVVSIFGISD
jgi:hypothetical protein